jgi:hypothetical protein
VEELLELERRFWHAGGDPGFYERHVADDGRCVFGMGILDKPATLEAVADATPWVEVLFDDVETVELDDGCVALVYAADAADDEGHEYRAMVTSVYVRREGAWQLALHQQTPRDAPPAQGA